MYPNLKAEMGRRNLSMQDLSTLTGIPYSTLAPKLRGERPLSLKDARIIKEVIGTSLPLEVLFSFEMED